MSQTQIKRESSSVHYTFLYLVILAILGITIAILIFTLDTHKKIEDFEDGIHKIKDYKDIMEDRIHHSFISK